MGFDRPPQGKIYDCLVSERKYQKMSKQLAEICHRYAPSAQSLLDVGCGTGRHLAWLQGRYDISGVDPEESMLELARARVPDGHFAVGSFHDIGLRAHFDVICSFGGAIGYCQSFSELRQACEAMVERLAPAGLLVIEPWLSPENFIVGRTVFDQYSSTEINIARMYVSQRQDGHSVFDMKYLVALNGKIFAYDDVHTLSLFTDEQYRECLESCGVELHDEAAREFGYGLFVGTVGRK
jgi:SAM-dependent methyltransferase